MDPPPTQCQICSRTPGDTIPFLCITCARNALYGPRVEYAAVLVHKEAMGKKVAKAVAGADQDTPSLERRSSQSKKQSDAAPRYVLERAEAQRKEAEHQSRLHEEHNEALRAETERLRALVAERKQQIAQRRDALDAATEVLRRDEAEVAAPLQEQIEGLEKGNRKIQAHTAEGRTVLCREAASLCGLRAKQRRKGLSGRDLYYLGGLPVIDLRDLNNADPAHVNASIVHITHLLHLTSYYLGLRLPAELVLPGAASAHPIIRTPISSYKAPTLPAGLRAAAAAAASSSSHTTYPSGHSRDRVLHLDPALPALAGEDPRAYGLFVDAVTLLAWDVAWLARTQGLDVGARHWEDLCAPGRTLWLLFAAPPPPEPRPSPRLPLARLTLPATDEGLAQGPATTTTAALRARLAGLELETPGDGSPPKPKPGQLTHRSARAFLAAAGDGGGAEWMRGWRFASHVRVIDRIKGALASERMGAEWEVLEKDAWEAEAVEGSPGGAASDGADATEGQGTPGSRRKSAGSEERGAKQEAEKAKRGWTKIRSPLGNEP